MRRHGTIGLRGILRRGGIDPPGGPGFTLVELPFDRPFGNELRAELLRVVSKCEALGFTLVELLVVVAIIAMLVAILIPSLARARELARRAMCSANLNGIGTGLATYATEKGAYPMLPLNGGNWNVAIGAARATAPADGQAIDRNPTGCLFLLVRNANCAAEMFLCPSAGEKAGVQSAGSSWDFADGKAISYALMNPYGTSKSFSADLGGSVPFLADASPYFDPAAGLRNGQPVVDLATANDEQARKGNSPNHLGEGQNVTFGQRSTVWRERADVGINQDNIYTRASAALTDRCGVIPSGVNGSAAEQGPAGPEDSFLLP